MILCFITTYVAEIQGTDTTTDNLVVNDRLGDLHRDVLADCVSKNWIMISQIKKFIRQQDLYQLSKRKISSCLLVGGFNPDEYGAHRVVPSYATHQSGISVVTRFRNKLK